MHKSCCVWCRTMRNIGQKLFRFMCKKRKFLREIVQIFSNKNCHYAKPYTGVKLLPNTEHWPIVNIAGILHHWFHLYRPRLVDSPDTFSVYYSVQVHEHCRQQKPENSDTPCLKNTANNMIMIIAYCIDRNMEIAAVYFSQAPVNSAKGFTASTNPSSPSLNRLFKE